MKNFLDDLDPQLMIRVHQVVPRSRANGPGARFVIWTQGCSLACPGCFNPNSHAASKSGTHVKVIDLVRRIVDVESLIEGITLSGGEPMEQPEAVAELLLAVRRSTDLGVVLFTGFTHAEIIGDPRRSRVLENVDAMVAGRYEASKRVAEGLRGSSNKRVVLLSNRYSALDIEETPTTEIILDEYGNATLTGISPVKPRGVFS